MMKVQLTKSGGNSKPRIMLTIGKYWFHLSQKEADKLSADLKQKSVEASNAETKKK